MLFDLPDIAVGNISGACKLRKKRFLFAWDALAIAAVYLYWVVVLYTLR